MMKKPNPTCLSVILFTAGCSMCSAQLRVDFNTSANGATASSPVLGGFQSYHARHESSGDFVAARSYSAFNSSVSLGVSFPDSNAAATMQMFNRSETTWQGAWLDLIRDWIGVDTRTENGGNGDFDGTTGTPTRLLMRLGGLPAGSYTWRSYHHDVSNQNGNFAVQLSTNGGTTFSPIGNFEMTSGIASEDPAQTGTSDPDPRSLPSTVTFPIAATGSQDVVIAFVPLSGGGIAGQFFACNGFELFEPANPPPGPVIAPPTQPAGTYAIDFGTVGSPVQSGYAQMLGANGSTVTINGVTFTLPANSLAATYVPSVSGNLISDFVSNTSENLAAGIVLQVNNLPAGTYTLESWHHDPTVTGAIQIETRTPQGFGNPVTVLVDQFAFGATPATTTFTTAGGNFDIIVREDSAENNRTRWNGLRITAGVPDNSPARPRSPWVFRTLMENRTRMLVAALHPNLWLSFNPGNCCIDRTWAGGMQLRGKVYNDSQLNPWVDGALYHRFPNAIFEATNEPAFPTGWVTSPGTVSSATVGTGFISPLRDKLTNRWFKFDGTTTVTTAAYDLSRHKETILFFEERRSVGTNWNLLPGSGTMRVEVSEDNGANWTSQDFFSTSPNVDNQYNIKQITSRSPATRLRFTSQNGQFANIILEGEYEGWTAADAGGAVSLVPNWLGYRTLNRDDAVTFRYQLVLAGGAKILVEETPEALTQPSGPPKLERKFAVSGLPAGTTVSLRLGRAPSDTTNNITYSVSANTESWIHSGTGTLRTTGGVTFLDLTADGTATVTASWTP